jgi:Co/Zn/Cd efflux system component
MVDYKALKTEVEALDGVAEVTALRVWSMDNIHHVAEVHLTTASTTLAEAEALKESLRTTLERYGVKMSTIEVGPAIG